ncbi:MAG TPA: HAD family hydrolase [Gemmatimonadaceae bacterium]|jgi:phosphoglycolate phosphatase-like HAD superfamily hydrolase|nr:HAD family hydrolase [Gemmatimonadaceae bacterium]
MAQTPRAPGRALRTILLDVDGTLIDSNDAHARAWVDSFAAHGYVVPFERVRPLIGKGGDKIIPELTGLDPESGEAKRMSETRTEIFLERELPTLRPTPGARALLERMTSDGYELVVATSAKSVEVRALLERTGVADLIQAASSSDDAERSKPDPDIVQAALRISGSQAAHSAMLGDTPYDVEAAARARVPAIALRCGGWWGDDELRGAVEIYDHPADLLARYDESVLAR